MRADARHLSLVKHDDLICMLDGTYPLSDNQHGGILGFLGQSFPQSGIGFKIQSRKAVVEDIEFRLFHQSPGNGQALFLTAGKVGAALSHVRVQSIRQRTDEVACLCYVGSVHQFVFAGILVAIAQIIGDGAGKQPGFLLNIGQMIPQIPLGHLPDIHSVEADGSFGYIVEPQNQRSHGGFAAAGAADDCGGLSSPQEKFRWQRVSSSASAKRKDTS